MTDILALLALAALPWLARREPETVTETVIATIYCRKGRLVLRRTGR